ncbi:c-type cytochrome [Pseudaminobacter sp. NGMCC 1.201702]|uniref:c-type cytochrome n=1 Tax=Pseudaminobacter sp. NGMCC 1.201702 TaxID=3391825 RepID=UPI0039EFC40D
MCKFLVAAIAVLFAGSASADDGRQRSYGEMSVKQNCSRCHAVALTDESAHPEAPAFRNLSQRYPIEALAEALAEGISVGHPDMPEFRAEPEEIGAIIAYIESLQR